MIDTKLLKKINVIAGLIIFIIGTCSSVECAETTSSTNTSILKNSSSISSADTLYYSEPEKVTSPVQLIISRPSLQALISIDKSLDPFQLDAPLSQQINLADVIDMAVQNNLVIQISSKDVQNNKWKLVNSYSKFLPDIRLGYLWDYLQGHVKLPVNPELGILGPLGLHGPFIVAQAGVSYYAFRGGQVLFTALQNRNNLRASRWKYHTTTNDVLLEAAKRYYNLILSEAILQVRIRAVATSQEQLQMNLDLEQNGKATRLDVLQARAQLADDKQSLIEQQVSRRNAAIQLAEYLNSDQSVDMQSIDTTIQPVRLITNNITATKLLSAAVENRPELKSYKEQWLAAKKGIMVAAAPLYPTIQLNATEYGIGQTLTNSSATVVTTPVTLGGTPEAVRVSKQITGLGVLGVSANWNLYGLGLSDFSNINSARVQARQALLQSNQEVNTVFSQVRQSYLNQLSAFRRIEESLSRVNSTVEELRLSQLRLQSGLGKNIDVLRAQQDLTSALIQHAQSTIDFNIAQVQLLHDLGLISRDNLLASSPLKL